MYKTRQQHISYEPDELYISGNPFKFANRNWAKQIIVPKRVKKNFLMVYFNSDLTTFTLTCFCHQVSSLTHSLPHQAKFDKFIPRAIRLVQHILQPQDFIR